MKWSHPHFDYKGIMCHMAAFKQHCAFGFWKAKLIFGEGRAGGKNADDAMGQFGRITALSDLPSDKVLTGYIKKAAQLNDAAFKQHCAFGFWKAKLIFGEGRAGGKNADDAMGQFGRITALSDLPSDKVLTGYIKKA